MLRHILPLISGLLVMATSQAESPSYQVLPQLGALAVNYHVETSGNRTVLYATNHESFKVICDAFMSTDKQEKNRGQEKAADPQQTISFAFRHRMAVDAVKLYLVCKPVEQPKDAAATDDSQKTYQAGKMAPAPAEDAVKEENLDAI